MEFHTMTNNKGSALLLLMGLLFFLTIIVGVVVRTTIYGTDIVACRGRTIEQTYATEALLLYAVIWCNQHLRERTVNDRAIYDGRWFEDCHDGWHGKVTLTLKKGAGQLCARLFDKQALVAEDYCQVTYQDNNMCVSAWGKP